MSLPPLLFFIQTTPGTVLGCLQPSIVFAKRPMSSLQGPGKERQPASSCGLPIRPAWRGHDSSVENNILPGRSSQHDSTILPMRTGRDEFFRERLTDRVKAPIIVYSIVTHKTGLLSSKISGNRNSRRKGEAGKRVGLSCYRHFSGRNYGER